jgi:hypothetical protein
LWLTDLQKISATIREHNSRQSKKTKKPQLKPAGVIVVQIAASAIDCKQTKQIQSTQGTNKSAYARVLCIQTMNQQESTTPRPATPRLQTLQNIG